MPVVFLDHFSEVHLLERTPSVKPRTTDYSTMAPNSMALQVERFQHGQHGCEKKFGSGDPLPWMW